MLCGEGAGPVVSATSPVHDPIGLVWIEEHNSILKALVELIMFAAENKGLAFRADTFYGIARMIEIFLEEQTRIIEAEIGDQKNQREYAEGLAENCLAKTVNAETEAEAIRRLEYVISCMGPQNEQNAVKLLEKIRARAKNEAEIKSMLEKTGNKMSEEDRERLINSFNAKTINISQISGMYGTDMVLQKLYQCRKCRKKD